MFLNGSRTPQLQVCSVITGHREAPLTSLAHLIWEEGGGLASWPGEGAEPSAGRWNGAFCQTCCIDHNGSQRELPFTAHCSQICAGNQEQPWFSCAAGVGEKRYLGGMREGTEKTWEISSTYFARTLQNSIHMSKSQHLCESSWVPFTDIESIKLIESGTQISLLLNSISKTIP